MHHLGQTRSARRTDHILHTPDTFVRAPLPGLHNGTAIIHAAPASGARFTQYTVEFEAGGLLQPASAQRFLFVLDGEIEVSGARLDCGGYAYLPPEHPAAVSAITAGRAVVIEKPYQSLPGVSAPACFSGREADVAAEALMGDSALEVRQLIPDHASFDFAVNTMTYLPGATLPQVEIHMMEHGLLMLAGAGIYRLGDHWYAVAEGDFIWMAPYCPQWFGALGKTPTKYLIYKDWNRGPLDPR